MEFELSRLAEYDSDSIIAELQRVSAIISDEVKLTRILFDKHAKVSSCTVAKRFGSWQKALLAADLECRYSGRTVSDKMKYQIARDLTDEQLIAELQRIALELSSDMLTKLEFDSRSDISSSAPSRRFGSWNKALRAAGLKPVSMGRRHTEEDFHENLLNVWMHFGRQPKWREMKSHPSVITPGAYSKRWGSWTKALFAFLASVNTEQSEKCATHSQARPKLITPQAKSSRPEDRRKPSLSLRYGVLMRDNFKCLLCGNSPATDPKCKLHVDHIVPFSKNGQTVQSNLRTLCVDCNLGKSDKIEP